jgi:hypothetical protein
MALTERYIGRYVSAESASNYIDAKGIIESANSIKTELEEFANFAGDVKTAGSDLTPKTLCIDGLDCSPLVEDVATLFQYAIKNETFLEIITLVSIPPTVLNFK